MDANKDTSHGQARFYQNWVVLAGAIVAAGSIFAFLLLFAIDLFV